MTDEGPQLETLLHRLTECPGEFLMVHAGKKDDGIDVIAVVCDHMRRMSPDPPELNADMLDELRGGTPARLALVSVACWLLHDEWFLSRPELATGMWKLLLSDEFTRLSMLIKPEKCASDPDRREELVRVCLRGLGLRPKGETASQAADRLTTLDSAERDRVLRATAAAERRAREVREAMAKKKAQEAASRYGE